LCNVVFLKEQKKKSLSEALEQLREQHSDSNAQLDVVRKEFETEREELSAKIAELETQLKVFKKKKKKGKTHLI
jgi:phage shock protein A